MSAFEDFVNLELPRRGVTFVPSMVGGYDGDPNDAGAPDVLKYSPTGTTYYEASENRFWRKLSAAAGDWEPGIKTNEFTTGGDIVLYVDNINGDDSNDGSIGSPLKSLVEAENRLPHIINHRVVIRVLPYDVSIPNAGAYEWPIFRARMLNEHIIVVGTEFQTISTGTAQAGTNQLKIVTTGGLTPDEYVNNLRLIQITSGNANGDIRLISENSTTDIDPSYPFSGVVNSGDTYKIITPLIRFTVPTVDDRGVLARGCQTGFGSVYNGSPMEGIYLVNANLESVSQFLTSDNITFGFFAVKLSSPTPTYIKSFSGILAGVEKLLTALPSTRVPTLADAIPELCPYDSSLSGCGLAVDGSLYLHTFDVGFDGYAVSTGNIGADLGLYDIAGKLYPIVLLRGGRCAGIYVGSTASWCGGYLKINTARIDSNTHVHFKVRANTSSPAVRARYSQIVLMQTDITNVGNGPAATAYGLGAQLAIFYSTGSASVGFGVTAEAGGEVRCDGSSAFSGAAGDFSEDGVTARAWSTLIADSWFRDAVRGSLVCRP